MRRLLGAALLYGALSAGLTACGWRWHESEDDAFPVDPPPECPTVETCSNGVRECDGDTVRHCEGTADGCNTWTPERECSHVGAKCSAGTCLFDEACPPGVEAFCRQGAIVECESEQVENFFDCDAPTVCAEASSESFLKTAGCMLDDDPHCISVDDSSVECRNGERLTCSQGTIVSRVSCGGGPCSLERDSTGELMALCGAGGTSN
jgi:hypothetical protein